MPFQPTILCSGDLLRPRPAWWASQWSELNWHIGEDLKENFSGWPGNLENFCNTGVISYMYGYNVFLLYYDHHSASLLLTIWGTHHTTTMHQTGGLGRQYAPIAVPVTERARNFRWFHQRTASCILRKASHGAGECHVMQQAYDIHLGANERSTTWTLGMLSQHWYLA